MPKDMNPRTSLRQKALLMLLGLLITIVLLEIGMRAGGFVMLCLQEHRNRDSLKQRGSYVILCVGESTTQDQYPRFLKEALESRNKTITFTVIDKGMMGMNTYGILNRMEHYLDKYAPDIVVAMMGANDRGKHMPYEACPTSSGSQLFLRSLKIYKLARFLGMHIVTKARELGLFLPSGSKAALKDGLFTGLQPPTNNPPQERVFLKRIFDLCSEYDRTYNGFIWIYDNEGKLGRAEEVLKKAIALEPGNEAAYIALGWLYRIQGKFDRAEEVLSKAIRLNPENSSVYVELGSLYNDEGKFGRAEEVLKKAIALEPGNEAAYIALGWLYRIQGKFDRAEEVLTKVIELNPRNYLAYVVLGWLYDGEGKFGRAEEVLKKAVELQSENHWAYVTLGWLYRTRGKFSEAEEMFREAIEKNPQDERLYGALASLYEETGQSARVLEYSMKANELRREELNPVTAENYLKLKGLLDRRNITLVCVQYPMQSTVPLKRIFGGEGRGVIFVDNEKVFQEKVKEEGYGAYFRDMFGGYFGHCTDKGNRLLAENIAAAISQRLPVK